MSTSARPALRASAALLAAVALLAACGDTDAGEPQPAASGSATAADPTASDTAGGPATSDRATAAAAAPTTPTDDEAPQRGGTLTWGWALPSTWDPVTSAVGNDSHALTLVYEAVTEQTADGEAAPGLADEWHYNETGDEITFHIRPGLTFSDGEVLDAAAVRTSLLRGRDDEKSTVAAQLAVVQDVVVDSPTDVRLVLDQPDYQIPLLLSGKTGMIVSPKAIATDPEGLATKPVGAGQFVLDEYVPDSHANLSRNPTFWNAEHIYVDEFVLKPTPEAAVAAAGLQTGQFNLVSLPASQVEAIESAGFPVLTFEVLPVRVLDVNNTVEPFDDPLVTQAINHAIDRQALIDVANFGYGKPLWQPFPDGYVAHNDELDDLYPYDPGKAEELLAEGGYTDGVDVQLAISSVDPLSEPLAELIQQQLDAVGIRTEIVVQTPGVVNYVTLEHPFVVDQFNARQSPLQSLEVLFGEQGLMNLGRNSPPDLQTAIDAARALPLDDPDYPAAVQEATKVGVTSLPNIFLFSVTRFFAHTDDVHGLVPHVDTWRFEDVWVEQ
jgi:ABC-type transport system substrate-binding protein